MNILRTLAEQSVYVIYFLKNFYCLFLFVYGNVGVYHTNVNMGASVCSHNMCVGQRSISVLEAPHFVF